MRFYTRWCDFCGKTLDAYGVGVRVSIIQTDPCVSKEIDFCGENCLCGWTAKRQAERVREAEQRAKDAAAVASPKGQALQAFYATRRDAAAAPEAPPPQPQPPAVTLPAATACSKKAIHMKGLSTKARRVLREHGALNVTELLRNWKGVAKALPKRDAEKLRRQHRGLT